MSSDLLHRLAHDLRRHVARDLHFSDLDGENKMDRAGNGLLVRGKAVHDFFGFKARPRQRTQRFYRRSYFFRRLWRTESGVAGNGGRGNHSPGHGFTVQQLGVAGRSFNGMAHGMTKVENAPQVGFFFVGAHDGGFYPNRIGNDSLQRFAVAAKSLLRMAAHEVEERFVANHAAFERLEQAGAKLALIEGGKDLGIDQDSLRLMKRAEKVLAAAKVHTGLAADAGVDLCQQSRRHLYDGDAAQKDGREETGAIADNAATQSHKQRLAISLSAYQLFSQPFDGL